MICITETNVTSNIKENTKCHPAGEAAEVLFDAVPKIGYKVCKEIIVLKPILWKKDKEGAWCKYLGEIVYGVVE